MIGEKIEWLDGDLSTLPASDEADDPRKSKNARGKGKDAKGKDKPKDKAKAKPAEVLDLAEQPQPVIEASERRDAIRASNDERRGKPQHEQKRRRDRDDDGPTPVGFGSDIPAFMLIPTGI